MHHPTLSARSAVIAIAAVAAFALLPASPASAHDQLVKANPADGASVTTALTSVDLTFAEPLVDLGGHRNGIVVTDDAGRHYETSCAVVKGDDLVVPVALGAGGEYHVQWRGLSDDGHVVGSTYAFTYEAPAGAAAASGSATGPSCGATGGTAVAASSASTTSTGSAVAIGAIIGGSVLVVVAVVLLLVLRLRRPQEQEAGR